MKGLEKAEIMLEKAKEELSAIQEKKAEILEKEKIAQKKVEEAEKNHIIEIVSAYKLNGGELKSKLASLINKSDTGSYSAPSTPIYYERNNEDENDD